MIGLDRNRNIIRDMEFIEKDFLKEEFLVVDSLKKVDEDHCKIDEYHYEPYASDRLLYLGEYDLFYSIMDLEKGILFYAPRKNGKWFAGPAIVRIRIPLLEKLLKNKRVTKSNAPKKIKERDNHVCQVCGETDVRVLNVHHIVPRKSPFITKSFIHSPLNQITLCANCHRIEHHVLEHGNHKERKEHVERLFKINGLNWRDTNHDAFYAPMCDIRKWNKIEIL